MRRRVVPAVLALFLSALLLYALAGYTDIADLPSTDTEWLVEIPRPIDLLWRLQTAGLITKATTGEPGKDNEIDAINERIKRPFSRAALNFFVSSAYVFHVSPSTNENGAGSDTSFVLDLGFAGRVVSDLLDLVLSEKTRNDLHLADLPLKWNDNFLILGGRPEGPAHAPPAIDADRLAVLKEQLRRSRREAARGSDVRLYPLDRRLLNPPVVASSSDPRLFLKEGAVERAFAEISFAPDSLHLALSLLPFAGKSACPILATAPGAFATRALADDSVRAYLGLRLDQPAQLSPLLLQLVAAGDEMKSLQKKMALLMFNSFFENIGSEMAIVLPAAGGEEKMPVFVFQIAQKDKLTDMLAALSKSAETQTKLLGLPVGPNGELGAEMLTQAATGASGTEWLTKLPDEERAQAAELLQKIRLGELDPEKLARDSQRLYFYKTSFYWRLAGDFLVLAPTPELAEHVRQTLADGTPPPVLAAEAGSISMDGAALARIDIGAFLPRGNPLFQRLLGGFTEKVGRLAVGVKKTDNRLLITGRAPLSPTPAPDRDFATGWFHLFQGLRFLVLGLIGLGLVLLLRQLFRRRD